jgi:UDP:flavonoid glycosyltransferase YjiC (YdhE family)
MHIGIQTWGSEGDCRPMLALAQGLREAGHSVKLLVTNVEGSPWAERGAALGVDVEDVAHAWYQENRSRAPQMVAHIMRSPDPSVQLRRTFEEALLPVHGEMVRAAMQLGRDSDLVIGHVCAESALLAAAHWKRPYVSVNTVPAVPSRYTTPAGLPSLGPSLNPLWWRLARFAINRQLKSVCRALREDAGLPPIRDAFERLIGTGSPNLISTSPTLVGSPADWPSRHVLCGYFHLPAKPAALSVELEAFLAAGPPPVYFTFGSVLTVLPPGQSLTSLMALLLAAVERAGVRAIVQAPWESLAELPSTEAVFRIGHAPHHAIFPRCSAVVHHAGAGTTHAACRAGKPSVPVFFANDQRFWATLLYRMGVAARPLSRGRLTASRLAAALRQATRPEVQAAAAAVGRSMASEDGVLTAIQTLDAWKDRLVVPTL